MNSCPVLPPYNAITTNTSTVRILSIVQSKYCTVAYYYRVDDNTEAHADFNNTSSNDKFTITLALPSASSLFYGWDYLDLMPHTFEIDPELLQQIIVFDIANDKSLHELRSYAIALNSRSFQISNVRIQGPRHNLDALDAHVLCAKMVNSRAETSYMRLDHIATQNPLLRNTFKFLTDNALELLIGWCSELI